MWRQLAMILTLSMGAIVAQEDKIDIGVKSPSPVQKCNCQCHHYTYVDAGGVTQGNCNSADATGAQWCYLRNRRDNDCDDIQVSTTRVDNRGRPRKWSYQACATPPKQQCCNQNRRAQGCRNRDRNRGGPFAGIIRGVGDAIGGVVSTVQNGGTLREVVTGALDQVGGTDVVNGLIQGVGGVFNGGGGANNDDSDDYGDYGDFEGTNSGGGGGSGGGGSLFGGSNPGASTAGNGGGGCSLFGGSNPSASTAGSSSSGSSGSNSNSGGGLFGGNPNPWPSSTSGSDNNNNDDTDPFASDEDYSSIPETNIRAKVNTNTEAEAERTSSTAEEWTNSFKTRLEAIRKRTGQEGRSGREEEDTSGDKES